jgi:hypothetical protein
MSALEIYCRPLTTWPRDLTRSRKSSPFKTRFEMTLRKLTHCRRWTDNLHAIALTLERLRLADLYGVTKRGEQYAGWKMLPGPITAAAGQKPTMSIDAAARFVAGLTGADAPALIRNRATWEKAFREAARMCHPDKAPQDGRWEQLEQAAQLLNGLHSKK